MTGRPYGQEHPAGDRPASPATKDNDVLAFLLFLVIVWIVIGIIGAVVHGLIWLTIIAAVLFLGTLFFGGNRFSKR